MIEFALASSFIILPLLIGTGTVGMSVLESIRVDALNRNAGHLYARGVDFSQTANRNMILQIAAPLNITNTGGTGVIVFSEIEGTGSGHAVCTARLVIGNPAVWASSFCNPTLIDSAGNVDYTNDPGAAADSFLSVLPLGSGDIAWLTETYFSTAQYAWPGLLPSSGIYTRAIF